jgi:hypothetical protein
MNAQRAGELTIDFVIINEFLNETPAKKWSIAPFGNDYLW